MVCFKIFTFLLYLLEIIKTAAELYKHTSLSNHSMRHLRISFFCLRFFLVFRLKFFTTKQLKTQILRKLDFVSSNHATKSFTTNQQYKQLHSGSICYFDFSLYNKMRVGISPPVCILPHSTRQNALSTIRINFTISISLLICKCQIQKTDLNHSNGKRSRRFSFRTESGVRFPFVS